MRGLLSSPAPGETDAPRDTGAPRWDPGASYEVDPNVALRPEPFGALAYHYGSRRLTFLRSPLLAQVVRELGDYDSVDVALAATVPPAQWPAFRRALGELARSRFIRARDAAPGAPA